MFRKILAFILALTFISIPFFANPTTASARPWPGNSDIAREACSEGTILLQNKDNCLPLPQGARVALFGQVTNYIRGGTGSGATTSPYTTTLLSGMQLKSNEGKIVLNPTYYPSGGNGYGVTAANAQTAANAGYTYAVCIINRNSGEGSDRSAADFAMTTAESDMINNVCQYFNNVIVVMNVGGMLDYTWTEQTAKANVKSVVLAWQGGMEGGNGIADVLVGDTYPSGRLPDTLARAYTDYPGNAVGNGIQNTTATYTEDIYVGYRYFETKWNTETLYNQHVKYPFGYGLNYTTFSQSTPVVTVNGTPGTGSMSAKVTVTNTGSTYHGKEVVQVYYQAPNGALNTPARELVAYKKTKDLAPGESQELEITWKLRDMASYDENGKASNGGTTTSCWILERGAFNIYIGNNVHDAALAYTYNLTNTTIVERLARRLTPASAFNRLVNPTPTANTLQTSTSTAAINGTASTTIDDQSVSSRRPVPAMVAAIEQPARTKFAKDPENSIFFKHTTGVWKLTDVYYGNCTMQQFIDQLTNTERGTLSSGTSGSVSLSGQGGQGRIANGLSRLNIPAMETNDGPAGLRLQSQTAIPIGTMLSSSWNDELVERVGFAVGSEMDYSGPDLWLAPGMNLHRDPRCGRNFEYYSEDPVLCGKIAAAISRGVHSYGGLVTLKHYSTNNQETNRKTVNAVVTERAERELYLRSFEIAVKEGTASNNGLGVMSVMSSYNFINGAHAATRRDMITGVMRDDWGMEGLVMTDWTTNISIVSEAQAGNDVKMPSGTASEVTTALNNGTITKTVIDQNMTHIMNTVMASKPFTMMLKVHDVSSSNGLTTRIDAAKYNDYSGDVRQHVNTSDDATEPGIVSYRVSGGTSNGYMATNSSVSYFLDVETTGDYLSRFRIAGNTASTFRVSVDGVQVGTFTSASTGGAQTWATRNGPNLFLTAGEHILTLTPTANTANINWFELELEDPTIGYITFNRTGVNANSDILLSVNGGAPAALPASLQITKGETYTLKVTAADPTEHEFLNWSGFVSSTSNEITVTPEESISLTANFKALFATITFTRSGVSANSDILLSVNGAAATALPSSIRVPTTAPLTLKATPADPYEYVFLNWSGGISSANNEITFTPESPITLAANFRKQGVIAITVNEESISATVKGDYFNFTEDAMPVRLILALYNEGGRLLALTSSEDVLVPSREARAISIEPCDYDDDVAFMVKAFLWDAVTFIPLLPNAARLTEDKDDIVPPDAFAIELDTRNNVIPAPQTFTRSQTGTAQGTGSDGIADLLNTTSGLTRLVGFTNGRYVEYKVFAREAGSYDLLVNYTLNINGAQNNALAVTVDGVAQPSVSLQQKTASDTRANDAPVVAIQLEKGVNIIRLTVTNTTFASTSATNRFGLNFICLWKSGFTKVNEISSSSPTKIMMGDFSVFTRGNTAAFELAPGTRDLILSNFSSAGTAAPMNVAPFNVPTNMAFSIDVEKAGTYDVVFHYANGGTASTNAIGLFVDGTRIATDPTQINFPTNGTTSDPYRYYNWGDTPVYKVDLPVGQHTLAMEVIITNTSVGNQYWFTVTPAAVIEPSITGVSASPALISSAGGNSVITVTGVSLRPGITVRAFDGDAGTSITGDTAANGAVTLSFPANTSDTTDKVYTIKASLDGGVTWAAATASVTVRNTSAAAYIPGPTDPVHIVAPDLRNRAFAYETFDRSAAITRATYSTSEQDYLTGISTGRYVSYWLDVEEAGDYYLNLNFATVTTAQNDALSVFVNDDLTPAVINLTVPVGGGNVPANTENATIRLNKGINKLTLTSKTSLATWWLNYLLISSATYEFGVYDLVSDPVKIFWSDYYSFDAGGQRSVFEPIPPSTGIIDGLCMSSFYSPGKVTWKLNTALAGTYRIVFNYSNGSAVNTTEVYRLYSDVACTQRLTTNPASLTTTNTFPQTATAAPNRWYTFRDSNAVTLTLPAGTVYLTIQSLVAASNPNHYYFTIEHMS